MKIKIYSISLFPPESREWPSSRSEPSCQRVSHHASESSLCLLLSPSSPGPDLIPPGLPIRWHAGQLRFSCPVALPPPCFSRLQTTAVCPHAPISSLPWIYSKSFSGMLYPKFLCVFHAMLKYRNN